MTISAFCVAAILYSGFLFGWTRAADFTAFSQYKSGWWHFSYRPSCQEGQRVEITAASFHYADRDCACSASGCCDCPCSKSLTSSSLQNLQTQCQNKHQCNVIQWRSLGDYCRIHHTTYYYDQYDFPKYSRLTYNCVDVDECHGHPSICGQHATCVNTVGSYWCNCSQGYEYRSSSTPCQDIDECERDPSLCGQHGKCHNTEGSYWCECFPGYKSKYSRGVCLDIDECSSNPCQHGGRCTDLVNDFYCSCTRAFDGKTCSIDIDECQRSLSICGQYRTCVNTVGSYRCDCPPGYRLSSGACLDINECSSYPCQHGGTCKDLVNDFNCSCTPDFEGKTCSIDVNECERDPSPCGQHGTCLNTKGSYRCDCFPGYEYKTSTGTCEDIDECSSHPCQHGGTCKNLVNNFNCSCTPTFVGKTCSIERPDLYIDSPSLESASGTLLRAMVLSAGFYEGPNTTWVCTVEATDCSSVNVTVLLNITNGYWHSSYFSMPEMDSVGTQGHVSKTATSTTPFYVELYTFASTLLQLAYVTARASQDITMACGKGVSVSLPSDRCKGLLSSADQQTRNFTHGPVVGSVVGAIIALAAIVVVVIVFRHRLKAGKKKPSSGVSVAFNNLGTADSQPERLYENSGPASLGSPIGGSSRPSPQRPLTSSSNSAPAAVTDGAVYAVAKKSKGGNRRKPEKVTSPTYAVVEKSSAKSRAPSARNASEQTYPLAGAIDSPPNSDDPPTYEMAAALTPAEQYVNSAEAVAMVAAKQQEEGYDVLGQKHLLPQSAHDVTYGHLGVAGAEDDVEYGYDHTVNHARNDVIRNDIYDTAKPSAEQSDDVSEDGGYDTARAGQGSLRQQ